MYNKFGCCLKNVFNLITIYPLKVFFRKTINFGQGEKIRMSDMQLAVVIIISGLVIVFLALIVLIVMIWAMGKILSSFKKDKKPQAPKQTPAAPVTPKPAAPIAKAQPVAEEGIPGEVVAAISAAVAFMMEETGQSGFVVKSIKRAREARPVWGLAGITENTRPF